MAPQNETHGATTGMDGTEKAVYESLVSGHGDTFEFWHAPGDQNPWRARRRVKTSIRTEQPTVEGLRQWVKDQAVRPARDSEG